MGKKLSEKSKNILSYRPRIEFIEPDQTPGKIEAIAIPAQREEVQDLRDQVKSLAKAVNTLAAAVQAKADIKAKNMVIKLDPITDAAVIASVKRMYGHTKINPLEITYEQYRQCKERMRQKGEELGERMIVSEEAIKAIKDAVTKPSASLAGVMDIPDKPSYAQSSADAVQAFNQFGGYNTEESSTGGLRPELQEQGVVIPPIDMDVLQAYIVRIFVNAVWEKFVYPLFKELPIVGELLPVQLVEIPSDGYSAEDLVSLGVPVFGYPKPEQPKPNIPEEA
jgi:hypothetical protein